MTNQGRQLDIKIAPFYSCCISDDIIIPGERGHGGAPGGMVHVVAQAVQPPVLSRVTLHARQVGWAHFLDEGLGRVYLRESCLNLLD